MAVSLLGEGASLPLESATQVLYGAKDNLTSRAVLEQFKQRTGAHLTIMEEGNAEFHTELQLAVLQEWEREHISEERSMKIEPRMLHLPNGEVLTVRSLCADDTEAMSAFRNAIYSETHFMARYPEEGASLEAMRNWLAGFVESPVNFEVGAFAGESWWGVWCCTGAAAYQIRHRAVVGISVRKDYWGCGLGSYLMQLAIDEPAPTASKQLELGVYGDNARAIHLYEKFGFERWHPAPGL